MLDYSLWTKVSEAEKVAGEIAAMWKAHSFLKKMRRREDKEALALASALGRYAVT